MRRGTRPIQSTPWPALALVASLLTAGVALASAQFAEISGTSAGETKAVATARVHAANHFARLPFSFEQNRGQADPQVRFLSRAPSYTLFLTNGEAVFAFPSQRGRSKEIAQKPEALRLRFDDADPRAQIEGRDELPGKTNYFPTSDRSTWHTGIPSYSAVAYRNVYPGVNAVFHGGPQRLEFDFDVEPDADPSKIALDIAGGRVLRLDSDGDIVLAVGKSGRGGQVTLSRPLVYQQIAGVRREIPGKFVLRGRHRIGFQLGAYDRTRPLVIDPTLSYSTYLGGSAATGNVPESYGVAVAVDSSGNAYVTGGTIASNFPTPTGTGGTSQPQAFASKFGPDGALLYTSFTPEYFTVWGIALDSSGSAYLGGYDTGFIATKGAYGGGGGAGLTVIKLSPDGSSVDYIAQVGLTISSNQVVYGIGIAVDSNDSPYLATSTKLSTFPTTKGAYQSACWTTGCTTEATVTKLSADGSSLVYSTLLGGHGGDYATGIAVDAEGDAYVTGATLSTDFPVTKGVLQPVCSSSNSSTNSPPICADEDVFVTELNPTGTALVYSTYLGNGIGVSNGADSQVGIAVDSAGNAYISGTTDSTVFTNGISSGAGPTYAGPQVTCGSQATVCVDDITFNFLAKIAPGGGTLAYLGFLGGYNANVSAGEVNGYTSGDSVAVDSSGNAYLTGLTSSSFFPTTSDALLGSFDEKYPYTNQGVCPPSSGCASEGYFSILNTTASGSSSLVYSTYLGAATLDENPTYGTGVAVDSNDNAWLTGETTSSTFSVTPGALESSCALEVTSPPYCYDYAFVTEFTPSPTVPAAAISAVSGGGQSAAIGQSFANPLVVNVTDASKNPVSGATVTFTVPSSGASAVLSSTRAITGSNGNASVTAKANGIASSTAYNLSASVSGVATPTMFALTNTQAATTLTVTPSATSLVYGQPVTVTAAISPSNAGGSTPSGSVTFYDGATALTPNSTVSSAAASYKVTVPTVGSHTYAAQYLGNSNFAQSALTNASSAAVVGKASVTLTGPATQPVRLQTGQAGSISVNIAGQFSGNGIASPSGSLNYSVSGNAFGPGSLLVANGSATISVPSTLPAGIYTITVSYAGDLNYNANSIQIQLIVYKPWAIGPAALPVGVVGTAYSQTLTATGGSGTGYTWSVSSGTALSAVGLTLSSAGVISGIPSKTESSAPLTVKVVDSEGNTATRSYSLTILSTLTIETARLHDGIVGEKYSATLSATGGSGTGYTWSISSGTALSAAGLTLSRAGAVTGTPTRNETSAAVTVKVTDSLGDIATEKFDLTILPALVIDPSSLSPATLKKNYSETLLAHGGSGAGYRWFLMTGDLAHFGLALSPAGLISGKPSSAGTADFTVEVKDSLGDAAVRSYRLAISAGAAVQVSVFEPVAVHDVANVPLINVSDNESVTVNDVATVPLINVSDNEPVTVNDVNKVSPTGANGDEVVSVHDISVIKVTVPAAGAIKSSDDHPHSNAGNGASDGP